MNEKTIIAKVILGLTILAIGLTAIVFFWLNTQFSTPEQNEELNVKYLEHYVAAFQILAVGVFAALITVVIPLLLPEARDRFERFKESRKAYSKAKTAVIYLPDKVANAADMKEAITLVQEAHRQLHFAETFENVIIEKGYLAWFECPYLWTIYNYWQIEAVIRVLRCSDFQGKKDRKLLRKRLGVAVQVVHKYFGDRGTKFAGKKWVIMPPSKREIDLVRFEKEAELEKLIDDKLGSLFSDA